ncbi:MAG: DUF1015 family protein [Bacteroidota bacterium]
MRIKPFQAVYPNFDYITSSDSFFDTVKFQFPEYKQSGFFHKTAQEALYIYQITNQLRTYIGIIACADIRDYTEGKIKKHENTLSSKEQQQMHLMLSREAAVKPVLLTYPPVDAIDSLLKSYIIDKPCFYTVELKKGKERHSFWEIREGTVIQELQKHFSKHVPYTYIADGHHRTSTSALMHERMRNKEVDKEYNLLLSAFFPTPEIEIHDYNRVVEGLNDCTLTTFMAKLSQLFEIEILEKKRKPKEKHEIIMFLNREWFQLKWRKRILKTHEGNGVILDANLLDEKVLRDILGIEDVRTDVRIKYVEGPKGLSELRGKTIKNENRVAFCLYPVQLADLFKIVNEGKTMPPKSTWFEPRMRNGLIVHEY